MISRMALAAGVFFRGLRASDSVVPMQAPESRGRGDRNAAPATTGSCPLLVLAGKAESLLGRRPTYFGRFPYRAGRSKHKLADPIQEHAVRPSTRGAPSCDRLGPSPYRLTNIYLAEAAGPFFRPRC